MRTDIVLKKLEEMYPQADTELEFNSNYQLLVAVMLSAQCTDKRVNVVTRELFKEYGTPEDMLKLSQDELEKKIFSCGFYKNKARNILATSKIIVEKYNGEVPSDWDILQTLPGVGRKTANVVAAVAFNIPAIAVDTHVFRVANRIGLAYGKDELQTELQLQKAISKDMWLKAHHLIIWHGRRCCESRKPKCNECLINSYCDYFIHLPKNE